MFSKRLSPIRFWKDAKGRRERKKSEVLQQECDRDNLESKIGRLVEETTARDRAQWEALYSGAPDPRLHHTDSGLGSSIPSRRESCDCAADSDSQEVVELPILPEEDEQSKLDRYASAMIQDGPCDGYRQDGDAREATNRVLDSWPIQSLDDNDLPHQKRRLSPRISFRSLRPRTKRPKPLLPMPSSTSIQLLQDYTMHNDDGSESSDCDCSVSPVVDELGDSGRQALLDMSMSPFASRTDLLGGAMTKDKGGNTAIEPPNHTAVPSYSVDDDEYGGELEVTEDDPERLEPFVKQFAAPEEMAGRRSLSCSKDLQDPSDSREPVLEHAPVVGGENQSPEEASTSILKLADTDCSQDDFSCSLSNAMRGYWTNEWAKHLEHADKPDSEEDALERPGSPGVHVDVILPDYFPPDTVYPVKKQVSFSQDHDHGDSHWENFDGNHTTPDTEELDDQPVAVNPPSTRAVQSRSASFNRPAIKTKRQRNFSLPTLDTTLMGQRQSILATRHQSSSFPKFTNSPTSPKSEHADKVSHSPHHRTSKAGIDPDNMTLAERRAMLIGRRDSAQHSPTSSGPCSTISPTRPMSSRRPPSIPGSQDGRAPHHQKRLPSISGSQDGRAPHSSNPVLHQSQFTTTARSKPTNPSLDIGARQLHLLQNWRQALSTVEAPQTIQEDRRAVMLQEKRVEKERREWGAVVQANQQAAIAGQWEVEPEQMEDLHRRRMRLFQKEALRKSGIK